MLERLLEYERGAFFLLNGSDCPALDRFFWLVSSRVVWLPLGAFIIFMIVRHKSWREYLPVLVAIAIVIVLADQFASHFCKSFFARPRPTHHPDFMNEVKTVFDYRGGKYGFMSSHAANAFGFAVFMSALFRNAFFTVAVGLWAMLTAYSRVYLGVHFISDVVAGGISGAFFGYAVYLLHVNLRHKWITAKNAGEAGEICTEGEKRIIGAAIIGMIIVLLLFNQAITIAVV
ncbi:MAG: phosphatase PAP2 family protein [Tannerellaceae bacterium]|jgi:undecaprenyl-diphosphatase|nr:phosphatase PAP2 family protein [Tannerellaceae bacterium]